MLNEQKKSNNSNRFYIIVLAVLLCAGVYSAVRGCGNDAGTAELYQRTDAAVGAVEKQHETIGCELKTVGGQLDTARETAGRIDGLINQSQNAGAEIATGITNCQRIVADCRKIVTDSNRIYREVEEANRSRAGSGG